MGQTNGRQANGRWQKGQSGNPRGRPSRATERRYLDILIGVCTEEDWEEVCIAAIEDAIDGDAIARKWLSDYIMGPAAKRNVNFNIPMEQLTDEQLARIASGEDAILVVAAGL
jgi:hypothetical protein